MSLLLTHGELEEITGKKSQRAQMERLTELGLVWRLRGDGALLVAREHFNTTFGVSAGAISHKRVAPELGNAR